MNCIYLKSNKEITFEERRKRFEDWHHFNGFKFKEIPPDENGIMRWHVMHEMGEHWSKFQFYLTKQLLESTGNKLGKEHCGELDYWIEFTHI